MPSPGAMNTPTPFGSLRSLPSDGALRSVGSGLPSGRAIIVAEPLTEILIAERPRQTVPPSQQVPSAWTRAMASGASATSTWFSVTSLRTSAPPSRSTAANRAA